MKKRLQTELQPQLVKKLKTNLAECNEGAQPLHFLIRSSDMCGARSNR